MKKLAFFISIAIFFISTIEQISAQKEDFIWVFDGGAPDDLIKDSVNATCLFDFNRNKFDPKHKKYWPSFRFTNSSLCDQFGQLRFFTTGVHIFNKEFDIVPGGYGLLDPIKYSGGSNDIQGALMLPMPGDADRSIVFSGRRKIYYPFPVEFPSYWTLHSDTLDFSILNMAANAGEGSVEVFKQSFLFDDFQTTFATVRHANGRDWWVIAFKHFSDEYSSVLIGPSGIQSVEKHNSGHYKRPFLGQMFFSPNGEKFGWYAGLDGILPGQPITRESEIFLADFDRCTGLLSNPRFKRFQPDRVGGGSFSPNNRFLYANRPDSVYQYDLEAADIWASEQLVGTRDGWVDTFFLQTKPAFFNNQIAPNGKIYINSPFINNNWVHTIEHPNRAGKACDFRQRSVKLPIWNHNTIPYFPNYRLGPIDGSACDTLGINNVPFALWYWEPDDSTNYKSIYFRDHSGFEPTAWKWNFGDGTTSQDTSPVHVFAADGAYQVCLIVSNQWGADTLCRIVEIGTVSTETPEKKAETLRFSPNPADQRTMVELFETSISARRTLLFSNILGETVFETDFSNRKMEVSTAAWSSGIYVVQFFENGVLKRSDRLVVVH